MEFKTLLFEKDTGIGILTLNRPKQLNAINGEMLTELSNAMDNIAADDEVKVLIITGGEKVFAAGGDIAFMSGADSLTAESFIALCHQAFDKIANLEKPVVAAIAGMALGGGCELSLCCDIRICSEDAKFAQPEINLGIIPGAGGTQRLARLLGPGWCKYLTMLGDPIDADTALRLGLVAKVVPPDQLMNEAKKIAAKLAAKPPVALHVLKKAINYGMNVDLASGLAFEQKVFALLFSTHDQKEGMKAFMEKRKPVYKGR
ncbi:MAG: enoyl-CoA hydratase/isomerase family protein [Syntrophothermus sp.]|uniref:enoyl-CoA hydratase/isomerase family protein n=1 Tax=Syntrophothermus sp. TaxID=2736299 RepID=UPI00257F5CCC|nr:enoyl-CoA hydratase-related protein [Syntrophothermus sp.]NSW83120.1 enoyl-CoA hydratase/isomerase family protein [Syntrophothermus sp.]